MNKISQLAAARKNADAAAAHKKALHDAFLISGAYVDALEISIRLSEQAQALENEIKAEYEAAFSGDKHPHPAINLKEFDVTTVEYDPTKAHNWCLHNFTQALKLDKAVFEKAAKAGDVPAEIAQVKPAKEIRAQIASDLSDYL